MSNFTKILVLVGSFLFMFSFSVSAATNYAVSGLCIEKSQDYGSSFFDVSAGSVSINGNNYNINATKGLLAENNSVIEVYAYKNRETNKAVIGTLINSINSDFKNNGVLIGRVYTGNEAINKNSSTIKFESYVLGCSNYIVSSGVLNERAIALNDTINTSSNLNVRKEPSSSANILGMVNLGSSGVVVGGPVSSGSHNWWQVRYDESGLVGWSAGDWLSKDASVPSPYFAQTPATAIDNTTQIKVEEASIDQLASMLEAAKALLDQMENSLKNLLR